MSTPHAQIQYHMATASARAREQQQSAPRPARARFTVKTSGVGDTRLEGRKAIDFGAYMLEEPSFSWGVEALHPLGVNELPLCTAIVLKYIKNSNGLYTGAEMGFRVDCDNSKVRLQFSLTFEASTLRSTTGGGETTVTASTSAPTVFRT